MKTRLSQLETDYLDKLSPEEKDFLNRFLEETVITNFQHKGDKLYKDRKPFYDANNARNRCLYTKLHAMGALYHAANSEALNSLIDDKTSVNSNTEEEMLLEAIALKMSGNWEEETELSPEERAELIKIGALKA